MSTHSPQPEATAPPLGAFLRSRRRALGLNCAQVAARSTLSAEVVRRYERGTVRWPRKTTLTKLAQALELPFVTLAAVVAERPVLSEPGHE